MQLYKEAGVAGSTFTGVPVFQAQGLTVKTENSRYTPLFLAKDDLDVAVGAAFSQREAAKEVANKSKASAAEEEVASAQAAVSPSTCTICLLLFPSPKSHSWAWPVLPCVFINTCFGPPLTCWHLHMIQDSMQCLPGVFGNAAILGLFHKQEGCNSQIWGTFCSRI